MPLPLAAILGGLKVASPFIGKALLSGAGQYALGRAGGYLGNKLFGGGQQQMDPFSQQQMQAERGLLGTLSRPYGEEEFAPIEQSAMRTFREQTLPQIQNQFGGVGQDSGFYNQAAAGAQAGLSDRLAALRAQTGEQVNMARQNALQSYLSGQQNLAQRQHEFNRAYPLDLFGRGLQAAQIGGNYRSANNPLNYYQQAFGSATGQPMENIYRPGTTGALPYIGQAAVDIGKSWASNPMRKAS